MNARKETILVVDDDPNIVKALSLRLKIWGFNVITAFDGVEALLLAESQKPNLIISDIWMPSGNGFSLAYRLREGLARIPIIFLTASKQANLKGMAQSFDAVAYLEKPYEPETLYQAVSGVLDSRAMEPQRN